MTEDRPADIPALVSLERDRLLALLRGLTPPEWEFSTPCEAWNVHQLCLHLLGVDLGFLSRRRDQYHGTPPPPEVGEDDFPAWLDELQMEWVAGGRRISPQLVIELLGWCGPLVADVIARDDPDLVAAEVFWAGPGRVPLWLDHARELSEYWIHRQQLLEALSRPPDLRPDLLCPILEGLRHAFPHGLRQVQAGNGEAVQIQVFDICEATWTIEYEGRWRFVDRPNGPVKANIRLTANTAWRLLTNNLPESALAAIGTSGTPQLVNALLSTRAIIGVPKWREWVRPEY